MDLSITAANVVAGEDAATKQGLAGEAIAAGKLVYLDATSKKYLLADNNSATAAARHAVGVALNGAALNQPLHVQTGGKITLGAVLTAGIAYFVSDTPGGICVLADVGSGEYICQLGLAESTTVLDLNIQFPNVAN
jgi:hypothetical protein